MAEGKKRLLTGLQPSGALHIGNYFGALKPFLSSYAEYESFLMVPDYHALTTVKNPTDLRTNIINAVSDYLALGIDPNKAIIFKQSEVLEHMELAWIFECLVTVPFLMQAHSYKDKVAKGLEANAGLFNYPMLMAADILMYDTDIVPVGQDQRQHVEYAREAAVKFNNAFGETFKEPKELIQAEVATVPGTDGQKMSKSYGNTIPLFGSKEEISKAVMSIVTDSGIEEENRIIMQEMTDSGMTSGSFTRPINLFRIHKLVYQGSENDLASLYSKNQNNYKALKELLIEHIETLIAPMRERRAAITEEDVKKVLAEGAEKARAIASEKMKDVRQKVGVSL